MANKKVENYIVSIEESLDNIISTVEPLSEETIRWNPSEEEWSILQIMNHVYEATHFWLGELKTVLNEPGSEWGRGLDHPARLAAVENPNELNVNEVIEKVKSVKSTVNSELSQVEDGRLEEENPHRNFEKFGNKPVSFLIEHFMVEHTEGHYGQIQRNLKKANE